MTESVDVDCPRQKLCEIIIKYGPAILKEKNRLKSLLKDSCPKDNKGIFSLITALEESIPDDLLNAKNAKDGSSGIVLVKKYSKRLQENCALSPETANWAVESWGLALEVIKTSEITKSTEQNNKIDYTQNTGTNNIAPVLPQVSKPTIQQMHIENTCSICDESGDLYCGICHEYYCDNHYYSQSHTCNVKPAVPAAQAIASANQGKNSGNQNTTVNGTDNSPQQDSIATIIAGLLIIAVIGIVFLGIIAAIGSVISNNSGTDNIVTSTPTSTPIPTISSITQISYVGKWTGHDSYGEHTLNINTDRTFEHRIESTGAVRYFKGTYTQQLDKIVLSYDMSTTSGYNYIVDMKIRDNIAYYEASGYVPNMPITINLTRTSTQPSAYSIITTTTPVPAKVSTPTTAPVSTISTWDTSLVGWNKWETSSGGGIVSSDGTQLSLRGATASDAVTLYRDAGMTPYDTIQVSVYNSVDKDNWFENSLHVGCDASGNGIDAVWAGSVYPSGIQGTSKSIDWGVEHNRGASTWYLSQGAWYDIKMICNGDTVTTCYKRSSDSKWILVDSYPISNNWKGGYIGLTGNYHGAYFKDLQIYKSS